MNIKDIPVRVLGPGSQPADDDGEPLSYIDMPADMWTYRPPSMPEPDDVRDLAAARESMCWLQQALAGYRKDSDPQLANLSALDDANRELVNQLLGEGEVAVTYSGDFRAQTQEAVLTGVWRTLYLDADDRVLFDVLEVADVPHTVRMPTKRARAIDTGFDDVPADVTNALPILVELQSHCAQYETAGSPHVINLSLLPLSPADLEFLDARLGRGPVDTLSRAYGKCQVTSTLTPNVWWVRYYNSMGTLILNTLEVVDVPAVICAAPEDLVDSSERLADILKPYWAEVA